MKTKQPSRFSVLLGTCLSLPHRQQPLHLPGQFTWLSPAEFQHRYEVQVSQTTGNVRQRAARRVGFVLNGLGLPLD